MENLFLICLGFLFFFVDFVGKQFLCMLRRYFMNSITRESLENVVRYENYPDGPLKSCILASENRIRTKYGELIPQYNDFSESERQKKYRPSLVFFKSGVLKSAALEYQQPIKTPIGEFPAELLTFYPSGALRRIFPNNGKIDGFWSEKQEGAFCQTFDFNLSSVSFTAKIIAINFYEAGAVKSITLWPGETIEVTVKDKTYTVRNGIAFYESGAVKSIEPATMTLVTTPIGKILAFDKDAVGIHGDANSLEFSEEGDILALITTHSGVKVELPEHKEPVLLEPLQVDSIIEFGEKTILPLSIKFEQDQVIFTDLKVRSFSKKEAAFTPYLPKIPVGMSCTDCSTCKACKGE